MTNNLTPCMIADALRAKLASPHSRSLIMNSPATLEALQMDPRTAAIIAVAIAEEQQPDPDADPLATLLAEIGDDSPDAPHRKPRKTSKRKAKAKPASKPAATKPPVAYTYRVAKYASNTVGAIVKGKEKGISSKTIALEQLDPSGTIVKRVLLGAAEAAMISALSPTELAKLPQPR